MYKEYINLHASDTNLRVQENRLIPVPFTLTHFYMKS
jgi:hypothetical protein